VANQGNNTIERFALPGGGNTPMTFATTGLNQPHGLAFDNNGLLYAANGGDQTIKKFDSGGTYINVFASGLANGYAGLAFDSAGATLYAAENGPRIQEFTLSGGTGSVFADATDGIAQVQFISIKPDCVPAVMTIAQYAGVTISGSIGCTYRIDYTTNLTPPVNWTPLTTITLPSSPYLYVDTTVISGSRFYQAVLLP
jgi:DNA-binding beta-propeller fold protein YncE